LIKGKDKVGRLAIALQFTQIRLESNSALQYRE